MKILMVFPYAALPPPLDLGGTKRNLPFFLELAKYHEVSVLSYGTPEEEQLFRKSYGGLCHDVRFVRRKRPRIFGAMQMLWLLGTGRSSFRMLYRHAMQRSINQIVAKGRFDLIHCCVHMFGYFNFPHDIPVTSDTHEVKYDLLRRTAEHTRRRFRKMWLALQWRLGKREEMELCRKFDLLITTTERDLQVFRKNLPEQNMAVVQNGAGNSFFEDLGFEAKPFVMVFTGLFTHLPNSDGIIYFLDHIFPRICELEPRACIYIVGKSPPRALRARASKNIVVTGFVEDVRPYIARAQVFVIPLLAGGGIRGKALEAMAMKRPIVTTTLGVEGIDLRHEHSALVGDTPDAFANAVARLFRDAGLRERIARNAFATVQRSYNWEAKGKELDGLLRSVVAARARKTSLNVSPTASLEPRTI
ncbi:MAG TPA: glycosyltransferase [Verrucomicrobiae bacterium]|nr:glycosyltransferase [Verrucomicrobiae bacterium]